MVFRMLLLGIQGCTRGYLINIFKSLKYSAYLKRFNIKNCPNETDSHCKQHRINLKINNRISKGSRNSKACQNLKGCEQQRPFIAPLPYITSSYLFPIFYFSSLFISVEKENFNIFKILTLCKLCVFEVSCFSLCMFCQEVFDHREVHNYSIVKCIHAFLP